MSASIVLVALIVIVALMLGLSLFDTRRVIESPLFKCSHAFKNVLQDNCRIKEVDSETFFRIRQTCVTDKLPNFPADLRDMITECVSVFDGKKEDPCHRKATGTFNNCLLNHIRKDMTQLREKYENSTETSFGFCTDMNDCLAAEFSKVPNKKRTMKAIPTDSGVITIKDNSGKTSRQEREEESGGLVIPSAPNAG